MRATSVGPTEGESLFIVGSALEEKFILRVEEEDAECAVRHRVFLGKISVGMSTPLIYWAQEMVVV